LISLFVELKAGLGEAGIFYAVGACHHAALRQSQCGDPVEAISPCLRL